MRYLFPLICLGFILNSSPVFAQHPNSNIYLFQLEWEGNKVRLTDPRFLTDFNSNGYNNQPSFISNEELYISVRKPQENAQTDLYSMNLENGMLTQLTDTPESEYSPMLTPDFYYFSAIRVEGSSNQTQRLWRFPVDRLDEGEPVFPRIRNLGYYFWINKEEVLLYIVDTPNKLILANAKDQSSRPIAENIGRCFQRLPNGNIAFVLKESPQKWLISELNLRTLQYSTLTETQKGSEDFSVLRDGTLLTGKGSKLYMTNPYRQPANGEVAGWVEIADLRNYDIKEISRLAVSWDNKLVVVGQ
jgi:hypothetical protein